MVVVIIVDPPGDPIIIKGLPFFKTIVGVIEDKGRFPGSIALALLPTNPNALGCLLYTSDAADDMQCVDLGGRRII